MGTRKALPAEVLPTHTNRNKLQQQKQLNYYSPCMIIVMLKALDHFPVYSDKYTPICIKIHVPIEIFQ